MSELAEAIAALKDATAELREAAAELRAAKSQSIGRVPKHKVLQVVEWCAKLGPDDEVLLQERLASGAPRIVRYETWANKHAYWLALFLQAKKTVAEVKAIFMECKQDEIVLRMSALFATAEHGMILST